MKKEKSKNLKRNPDGVQYALLHHKSILYKTIPRRSIKH